MLGPHPKSIKSGKETLRLHECAVEFHYDNSLLDEIIKIYKDIIFSKGYASRCSDANKQYTNEYLKNGRKKVDVKIKFDKDTQDMIFKNFDSKYEAYKLQVSANGNVELSADFYPGIIRALDTFAQLVERNEQVAGEYHVRYAPVLVKDEPKYPYRGQMLDTSKEYFFPETIKQLLDAMMISRQNVFHWHFMDSDSFPVRLDGYEDITDYTAFSKREVYTAEMVADLVRYAKVRGITVIPELSGPAHVNAIGNYPKLRKAIS